MFYYVYMYQELITALVIRQYGQNSTTLLLIQALKGGNKILLTLSGKDSNDLRTGSRLPNLEDLNRRRMSCRVEATRKYSCFRRSSFPEKNCQHQEVFITQAIPNEIKYNACQSFFLLPCILLNVKATLMPMIKYYGMLAYISI